MQSTIFATLEQHEIRFRSLLDNSFLAFPCDSRGAVEMDALGEHERHTYLYARALIGHSFALPVVVPVRHAA